MNLQQTEGIYRIGTAAELGAFRDGINSGAIPASADARLTADIRLSGNWEPIGTCDAKTFAVRYYGGMFDGGGFTVSGLRVAPGDMAVYDNIVRTAGSTADPGVRAAGLFGVLAEGATVRSLRVSLLSIEVQDTTKVLFGGGIAGYNDGMIEDAEVTGGTMYMTGSVGGIAGINESGGTIQGCAVRGVDMIGGYDAGGVVGLNAGLVKDSSVNNVKRIAGEETGGGVVGLNEDGSVENCIASEIGAVEGEYAGGIAGNGETGAVENCTASGVKIKATQDD